ncbi:MAG: DUF4097 family beta strand repeat-containing protein [Flammeovirgaceae bacterium]
MKKLFILFALSLISVISFGQDYKTKLNGAKKVVFVLTNTDLWVEAHDGDEIIIEAKGYQKPPERADGLKPLYNSYQDNTGIGLSTEVEGGILKFIRASSRKSIDYKVKLPRKVDLVIEEANWNGGDFNVDGMQGEVEVKGKNADIFLTNVSGPIVAHSTSGNVQVVFTKITPDKPSAITATSGYVDVTLPQNVKANVSLRAISGEIYTDFDVTLEKNTKDDSKRWPSYNGDHKSDDCHSCGHNWNRGTIKGAINGGGVELTLKAISGDIYLRKAK